MAEFTRIDAASASEEFRGDVFDRLRQRVLARKRQLENGPITPLAA
jgi:hypothetical protein